MRYIKKYEDLDLKIDINTYYLIDGDRDHIIDVIKKIIPINYAINEIIENLSKSSYNNIIGIYLGNSDSPFSRFSKYEKTHFGFWPMRYKRDKIQAVNYYSGEKFEYKGELKIVDDELILDELSADIEKYNL